jgi:hypothetical protein
VFPVFQTYEQHVEDWAGDVWPNPVYSQNFPHFAGINPAVSTTSYAFQVMPELCVYYWDVDQAGYFPFAATGPTDDTCTGTPPGGGFGQDSYGRHDGIGTWTIGNFFFVGYDGQGATWGDQFYQYNDDGLLVGQFGNTPYYDLSQGAGHARLGTVSGFPGTQPIAGSAGNIAMFQATRPDSNGVIYLYHTDEGHYGGIHRWSIRDTASVSEVAATITSVVPE